MELESALLHREACPNQILRSMTPQIITYFLFIFTTKAVTVVVIATPSHYHNHIPFICVLKDPYLQDFPIRIMCLFTAILSQ